MGRYQVQAVASGANGASPADGTKATHGHVSERAVICVSAVSETHGSEDLTPLDDDTTFRNEAALHKLSLQAACPCNQVSHETTVID
jgi:hypothetical protein